MISGFGPEPEELFLAIESDWPGFAGVLVREPVTFVAAAALKPGLRWISLATLRRLRANLFRSHGSLITFSDNSL